MGRCQDFPHMRADRSEDQLPLLMYDYAYLCTKSLGSDDQENLEAEQKGSSPVLVGWDCRSKRYWAYLIPAKGCDFEGYDAVVYLVTEDLRRTGYHRANVRSDGEPALVAFLNGALSQWKGEVVPETTAPGDWKAHGPVENAVRLMNMQSHN